MTKAGATLFSIRRCQRAGIGRAFIPSLVACIVVGLPGIAHAATANKTEPIVLGALYNLTGFQSELDGASSQGARQAVSEINRAGGVLGRQIRLITEDGESRPEVLRRKTTILIERNPSTSALMGLSDTDMVLGAAPVAAVNGRLFLTSGATSPRLPAEVPRYLFLACFGDNVQAAAAAEWARQNLHARTGAIIYDASKSYTRLLQGYFRTRFEELGGHVQLLRGYTKDRELNDAIRAIRKPDLVYLSAAAPEDIVKGVRELRAAGFSGPIVGGDSFDSDKIWRQYSKFSGIYFTTHAYLGRDNLNPKVAAFRKAYIESNGHAPDAFAALGYDTARLLVAAIDRAKSTSPKEVLEALAGIERFEGVTGRIGYSNGSRIPKKSVAILHVEHERISLTRQFVPNLIPTP